ncbi:MAG TPA: cupredoxin domain-containing protein, partial [Dehalococcoidia bacterium]|nr:cupredoxin domain-containing protein [Dehalococcoidia bacterium]
DLSDPHRVPTGVAMDKDGNYYVGTLGVTPYPDGSALVFKVTPDGKTETVWTGLTMVTDLAIGPDGALYTSFPAVYAEGGAGGVARIDLAAEAPIEVPSDILKGSTCAPVGVSKDAGEPSTGPPAAAGEQVGTPIAAPAEATETSAPGELADGEASEGTSVEIKDYAFNPPTLTVPAGSTVTWTNVDAVPHTATAQDGSFDSGNLNPGQSFAFTFPTPGSHPYVCQYHAGMQGTIVVQ